MNTRSSAFQGVEFVQQSVGFLGTSKLHAGNSLHFTSAAPSEAQTETDILKTEESILAKPYLIDEASKELMQIEEEHCQLDSRMELHTDRPPGRGTGPFPADSQLLSNRNWKQLDPSFFEQRNRAKGSNHVRMHTREMAKQEN